MKFPAAFRKVLRQLCCRRRKPRVS